MIKWNDVLPAEARRLAVALAARAEEERTRNTVFPAQQDIFRALELTPPDRVSVCIVGQDPYIRPGQATGLAFSVPEGTKVPPSLRNIFKELHEDVGCAIPPSGDLTTWAERGVLLLNTVLTVQEGVSNSHAGWGWQQFTRAVFQACAQFPQPVVFVTWGGPARAFISGIPITELPNKAAVWSSHPSPLGATKGNEAVPAFLGSRPFSRTNRLLEQMGGQPINWNLT